MANVERFASTGVGLKRFAFAEVKSMGNAATLQSAVRQHT